MIAVDVTGLAFTLLCLGVRYPPCGLAALLVQSGGQIAALLMLGAPPQSVTLAGFYSQAAFAGGAPAWLPTFGGLLANLMCCVAAGGVASDGIRKITAIRGKLEQPLAMAQLRLALLTGLYMLAQIGLKG